MLSLRERLSALRAGILTTAHIRKRGFFIPYAYAGSRDDQITRYEALMPCFEAAGNRFESMLDAIEACLERLRRFGSGPLDPKWSGRMYPPRDGATAYAMVCRHRPRRIIEIGSGSSTHFMARAVRDCDIECEITCIDPAPRSDISALGVNHIARVLAVDDLALVERLEPDDILFIDSSHIMLPGMDVDIEFNCFFPVLAPGVLVHVHDIFLPYRYPTSWAIREWSEQNSLIGWIHSSYFELLFAGYYASLNHAESWSRIAAAFAPLADPSAGSLWLRRPAKSDGLH
ncbi:MAG: class I SAM-dependent methyltransferase [Amaricoccus sp.]